MDITAGYRAVELMKKHIARTETPGVIGGLGGFGGLFAPDLTGMEKPILVSGTDGVGTKLKLAFLMDRHDTVGIDCVAMCVNDIICCGAKPLFFLDYIACGKNVPERIEQIVKGVCEGCVQAGAALIGGETAEMPGFYPENEYDLAGYSTGIVDREKILDPKRMRAGGRRPGPALLRRAFQRLQPGAEGLRRGAGGSDLSPAELGGRSLGETLLTPTKIYVKPVLALLERVDVRGISHITGGGFYENIPRSIPGRAGRPDRPEGRAGAAHLRPDRERGGISERDMFNTFNMGVGMSIVVPAAQKDEALEILRAQGEDAYEIGVIRESDRKIEIAE